MNALRAKIRDVPDFPKKGILFKDLTPALQDPAVLREVVETLAARYRGERVTQVVGIESRGFLVGAPLAYALGVGLCLVRKSGKLPHETISESYALEYGTDRLQMHKDALTGTDRVVVVDDLLATGGTAEAAGRLVTRLGAEVLGYAFLIELGFLKGAERLGPHKVHSLIRYE